MFCGKCGAQNPEGTAFCQKCGASLDPSQPAAKAAGTAAASDKRNRTIGMAAVGIAAVVAVALLFTLLGGRSYKKTVTKYLDATFDADAKAIINLIPDAMVDRALEELGCDRADMDDALDELSETLENTIGSVTRYLGDDWKVSYEIVGAEDLSDRQQHELAQDYSVYDVKIGGAKDVTVKLKFKVLKQNASLDITIPVVKVGRSWYLDAQRINEIF